jgi:hypothetical protein
VQALPAGLTVKQGITDAAGAKAIGVSADGYDQLLLDPVSYQVIGLLQLSTGIGPEPAVDPERLSQWPRKDAIILSLAYAQVSDVRGPGITGS